MSVTDPNKTVPEGEKPGTHEEVHGTSDKVNHTIPPEKSKKKKTSDSE